MDKLLKLMPLMLLLFLAGCSSKNDDEESEVFSTTLNMMNEDNGKTIFERTGYYIDNAGNFTSEYGYWCIVDAGNTSLSNTKWQADLENRVRTAAVQYNHSYHFFRNADLIEFPSGTFAVPLETDFYKLRVEEPIKENGVTKGAVVKFVKSKVSSRTLPAKGSVIGSMVNAADSKIEIPVPKGAEYCEGEKIKSIGNIFDNQINDGKLIIKPNYWSDGSSRREEFDLYIRQGSICTKVLFYVVG